MSVLTGVRIKWIVFRENVRAFFPHGNSKLSVKWGFDQCSLKKDHSGLDPGRVHPPHLSRGLSTYC